ncbi:hypothetical protein MRB53_015503 [Persea americana]|uniref:Uncharacterized protein n=1 Tax=Persea americana TaxID=3435 RepID=A0ACC2LZN0_PERAE|nr:hypothetical protein MRB53_015503 [Persea americana]
MLDVRGMFEVWEAMKSTNERAPIDDFNTLHRRMDQLELMVMSCPHEAESSVPRRYRKYFEMQNTTLSALIHPGRGSSELSGERGEEKGKRSVLRVCRRPGEVPVSSSGEEGGERRPEWARNQADFLAKLRARVPDFGGLPVIGCEGGPVPTTAGARADAGNILSPLL